MRILHISLYDTNEPLIGLRTELSKKGMYSDISFVEYAKQNGGSFNGFEDLVIQKAIDLKPELVFMHLQSGEPISNHTIDKLKAMGAITIGFTGDVRQPLPEFYYTLGMSLDLSLFTNYTDVEACIIRGIKAGFIHVGYDSLVFNPDGEQFPQSNDIVFMGNNYTGIFPLSSYREDIVKELNINYHGKVAVFGSNWEHLEHRTSLMYRQDLEAAAYRRCKVAINCSHYDLPRYSSDRLNRIMGSGAFCLSQRYKGIEADFIEGKEIECFGSIGEMKDKLSYYLNPSHDYLRIEIAKAGHKKMVENFTWSHFADKLINLTEKIRNERN